MENIENLSLANKGIIEAYNKGYRVTKEGILLNPKGEKLNLNLNVKIKYYQFKLRFLNKILNIKVHRLQAYLKFGNKIFDDKIEVRHLDGNYLNNNWNNIEIGNRTDNALDIKLSQRIKNTKGSTKIRQKYSNELIIYIRHKYITKQLTQIQLSKKFNIPKSGIHHILNNLYLFERLNSDNILNKKPDLEQFRNIEIDEIKSEDIVNHLNKEYSYNQYSNEFCNQLKELCKVLTHKELSEKFNISKGMIAYLIGR